MDSIRGMDVIVSHPLEPDGSRFHCPNGKAALFTDVLDCEQWWESYSATSLLYMYKSDKFVFHLVVLTWWHFSFVFSSNHATI